MDPDPVPDGSHHDGAERPTPVDPRIILANERTLLSWVRTSLAFIAGGLAVTELLRESDLAGGRRLIGLPLIVVGAIIAVASHRQWQQRERSLQAGEPFAGSALPAFVTAALVVGAAGAVLFAVGG